MNFCCGEGFSRRARMHGFNSDCRWPALEILPRWKPRGLGDAYGESMTRVVPVDAVCRGNQWFVDVARMDCGVILQHLSVCFAAALNLLIVFIAAGRK
jgi:hypothetical protein